MVARCSPPTDAGARQHLSKSGVFCDRPVQFVWDQAVCMPSPGHLKSGGASYIVYALKNGWTSFGGYLLPGRRFCAVADGSLEQSSPNPCGKKKRIQRMQNQNDAALFTGTIESL